MRIIASIIRRMARPPRITVMMVMVRVAARVASRMAVSLAWAAD